MALIEPLAPIAPTVGPSTGSGRRRCSETCAARPGPRPDSSPDALPAVLRALPGRHPQHMDRRGSRPLRRPGRPRPTAPAGRATTSQAPGGLFRHWRLDRGQQPGAQPVQAHQRARSPPLPVPATFRRSGARAVLFDPARYLPGRRKRARRGLRRHRAHPVHPGQGAVLLPLDRFAGHSRAGRVERRPQGLLIEPGVFRSLHRRALLFRRLCLCVLPAVQGPPQRARLGHQLGVPGRERPHELCFRCHRHGEGRGARAFRRRLSQTRSRP